MQLNYRGKILQHSKVNFAAATLQTFAIAVILASPLYVSLYPFHMHDKKYVSQD